MRPCACRAAPSTASARWSTSSGTMATTRRARRAGGAQRPPAEVPRADHGDAQARRRRPHDARRARWLRAGGGCCDHVDRAGRAAARRGAGAGPLRLAAYYGRCSCPDEATCPLRDVMIDVRDAMLEILDKETLAELAARQGRASIDPRGLHEDALAGRRPDPRQVFVPEPGIGARSVPTGTLVAPRAPNTRRSLSIDHRVISRILMGSTVAARLNRIAHDALASFVGVGRGVWLFPLDVTFRTVGLRYGWLMTLFTRVARLAAEDRQPAPCGTSGMARDPACASLWGVSRGCRCRCPGALPAGDP